jgi:hypothetical protein
LLGTIEHMPPGRVTDELRDSAGRTTLALSKKLSVAKRRAFERRSKRLHNKPAAAADIETEVKNVHDLQRVLRFECGWFRGKEWWWYWDACFNCLAVKHGCKENAFALVIECTSTAPKKRAQSRMQV